MTFNYRPAALLILLATSAYSLTVDEAYRAIPHRRTVFAGSSGTMPAAERAYLTQLFEAVDLAIVAKIEMRNGVSASTAYDPVWTAWKKLKAPSKLQHVQTLFKEAIENEQASLTDSRGRVNSADPRTQVASAKLHEAYDETMRIYPNESATVRDAFFDYPCALDFY